MQHAATALKKQAPTSAPFPPADGAEGTTASLYLCHQKGGRDLIKKADANEHLRRTVQLAAIFCPSGLPLRDAKEVTPLGKHLVLRYCELPSLPGSFLQRTSPAEGVVGRPGQKRH